MAMTKEEKAAKAAVKKTLKAKKADDKKAEQAKALAATGKPGSNAPKKDVRTPAVAPKPPMLNGSPDLTKADHWEKDPETKAMIYVFANGARHIVVPKK